MKKLAPILIAAVAFAAFIGATLLTGFQPPLDAATGLPAVNTAGDSVFATLVVDQTAGSGILTLPLDGGIFTPLTGAADGGMAVGDADGSGCITGSTSTGAFTIAKPCGRGEVELMACVTNVDEGNTGKAVKGAWSRTRASVTTQVGQTAVKTELVDAGANAPLGCVVARDIAVLSDTYAFTYATSGSTAATTTTKGATLTIRKILNN